MKILFIVVGAFSPVSGVGKTAWSLSHALDREQLVSVIASGGYRGENRNFNFRRVPFWHPGRTWEFFLPIPSIWNFLLGSCLCRIYRKRFDIIHVFNGLVWSKNALITLQMCQKGAFRMARGRSLRERLRKKTPKHLVILFLEWLVYRRQLFRRLVVCSRSERDEVILYYKVNPEKITVLYNGIDLSPLAPSDIERLRADWRRKLGYRENDRVCLFVGYDLKRKGLKAVLKALVRLSGEYKLLVVGGRDERGEFKQFIQSLDLEPRVRLAGQHQDITSYYSASDLFILPTRYEPFGTAILEAMNWGLPVVTSRLAGAAELITPGREGYLLGDPEDPLEIASLIRRIVEEGKLVDMGAAAKNTARGYTWDKQAEELMLLYRRLS